MTVSVKTLRIALAAVALLVAGAVALSWESESTRIRKVFAAVERDLRKEGAENPVATALRVKRLTEKLAPGARITIPELGFDVAADPERIRREALYVLGSADSLRVTFDSLRVQVASRDSATATADVLVVGTSSEFGRGRDVRALTTRLEKDDGAWRFRSIRLERIVE